MIYLIVWDIHRGIPRATFFMIISAEVFNQHILQTNSSSVFWVNIVTAAVTLHAICTIDNELYGVN